MTWADVTAQAEIFRVIGEHFPEHAILGEEGDGGGADTSYTWIVDPLDGTSNYASGVPFACTSVGVKDTDGVVAGAIFAPFSDELFTATRGGGAWLADQRLNVGTNDTLARDDRRHRPPIRRPGADRSSRPPYRGAAPPHPWRPRVRLSGAVPGVRRRRPARRVLRARRHLRVGRRAPLR